MTVTEHRFRPANVPGPRIPMHQQVLDVAVAWALEHHVTTTERILSDPVEMLIDAAMGEFGPQHVDQAEHYYYEYLSTRPEG